MLTLEQRVTVIEDILNPIKSIDIRLERIELVLSARLDYHDQKIDHLDKKVDHLDKKIEHLTDTVKDLADVVVAGFAKITRK